jgi:hypothetical protein
MAQELPLLQALDATVTQHAGDEAHVIMKQLYMVCESRAPKAGIRDDIMAPREMIDAFKSATSAFEKIQELREDFVSDFRDVFSETKHLTILEYLHDAIFAAKKVGTGVTKLGFDYIDVVDIFIEAGLAAQRVGNTIKRRAAQDAAYAAEDAKLAQATEQRMNV